MNISIATFISGNETIPKDFFELFEYLKEKSYRTMAYVFTEKYISGMPVNIMQISMPQTTKYLRIMRLVQESRYDNILFIDSDITIDKEAIQRFLTEYNRGDYALAWGRIGTTVNTGFVPSLIEIDKILSHNIIRPSLWRMGLGVSLPGQVFILNKKYFAGRIKNIDTVYDDLALGVILKKNSFPYYMSKECLGTEMPKLNLQELNKQRKRWARGYAETLYNNRKGNVLKYVLIHGFAYHFLWMIVWGGTVFMLLNKQYITIAVSFLSLLFILSWGDLKRVPKAFIYICVFPFVHLKWLLQLFKSLYTCFVNDK